MSQCKQLIVAAFESVGELELAMAIIAPPEPGPPKVLAVMLAHSGVCVANVE